MTRQAVRERLAVLMAANDAFDEVYDYAPLDLRGKDRVLCIYSDRSHHEMLSASMNNAFYGFILETYALRRVDPAAAEDALDDMHEAVRAVIRANINDANWNELDLAEDSDALFAQVAKEPYRVERHQLRVKVTG